jgi:hypothetical protein
MASICSTNLYLVRCCRCTDISRRARGQWTPRLTSVAQALRVSQPAVAKRSKRSYGTPPQAMREAPKPTKPIEADTSEDAEFKHLAKPFHRCLECGVYILCDLNAHTPKCCLSLQRFWSRLWGAKKTLETGGDVDGDSK